MRARFVLWDLDGAPVTIEELRAYLAAESVDAFAEVEGLLFKSWVADGETNRWGAFYLWASAEAAAQPLPSRARELIGKDPDLAWNFDVEATVQGPGAPSDLARLGLAFEG